MHFWTMLGVGVLAVGALILAVDLRSSRKQRERLANREPDNWRREDPKPPAPHW